MQSALMYDTVLYQETERDSKKRLSLTTETGETKCRSDSEGPKSKKGMMLWREG